jgi:hypothetical protein
MRTEPEFIVSQFIGALKKIKPEERLRVFESVQAYFYEDKERK